MEIKQQQIVNRLIDECPFIISENIIPYILEAMQLYADQESINYANWLSNQVVQGRTYSKLWIDYKSSTTSQNG